jgi:BlaI family penicillinase repressor
MLEPATPRLTKNLLDTNYYHGSITEVIITMSKSKVHRLGDLQLRIMQSLWERGDATVATIHEALADEKNLAYTTIATMLRKMEARGLVKHRVEGRSFVYRAAVASEAVSRGMAGHLLDRLFEGSLADMVHHLLSTRDVSREELSKIERLILERKKAQ